jgi:hypothetical protein
MPLVPAKCTQCGASLSVDSNQEAAISCKNLVVLMSVLSLKGFNSLNDLSLMN